MADFNRSHAICGVVALAVTACADPIVRDDAEFGAGDQAPVVVALVDSAQRDVDRGALEQASDSLERALRIAPGDATIWSRLAWLRLRQDAYQQAVQLALRSNSMTSDKALRRYNFRIIEQAYRGMGDTQRADEARSQARQE